MAYTYIKRIANENIHTSNVTRTSLWLYASALFLNTVGFFPHISLLNAEVRHI